MCSTSSVSKQRDGGGGGGYHICMLILKSQPVGRPRQSHKKTWKGWDRMQKIETTGTPLRILPSSPSSCKVPQVRGHTQVFHCWGSQLDLIPGGVDLSWCRSSLLLLIRTAVVESPDLDLDRSSWAYGGAYFLKQNTIFGQIRILPPPLRLLSTPGVGNLFCRGAINATYF